MRNGEERPDNDDTRRHAPTRLLPRHPRRPSRGRPARARLQFQLSRGEAFLDLLLRHPRRGDLGCELARGEGRERIYIVEPTGPFEDDPNLTDKKFPGNPTKSYRSRAPLRIVGEVTEWEGHSPERLKEMKDFLAKLEAEGDMQIID
jgi:Rifampin ADP-ribosyl transferase